LRSYYVIMILKLDFKPLFSNLENSYRSFEIFSLYCTFLYLRKVFSSKNQNSTFSICSIFSVSNNFFFGWLSHRENKLPKFLKINSTVCSTAWNILMIVILAYGPMVVRKYYFGLRKNRYIVRHFKRYIKKKVAQKSTTYLYWSVISPLWCDSNPF
jgi:hypothetical protein